MTGSFALRNGRIRTSDPARPTVGALVVTDGELTWLGDDADLPTGLDVPVHDLGGRTVVPGLVDAHTHPEMVTTSMWHVPLPRTTDVEEILAFVGQYARTHPVDEAPFLYFEYYPSETFADRAPTRQLLDSAVSDRPVLCQDASEHACWVNTRMLELMGVTAQTPDPLPGLEVFVRDEHGEPTGHVLEMAHAPFLPAMYERLGWSPPQELTAESIAPFFRFLTEHGVTAVFEALVEDDDMFAAVAELDRRGELAMRYEGAVRFRNSGDVGPAIERLHRNQARHGNDHISISTLKLFLDGTNESGNSAVLAPLCHAAAGDGEALGAIGMEAPELTECLTAADRAGVDVHIHLVGDRAFRVACDAVEAARQVAGDAWRTRVTFAHCELVDPADMPRPAELGIYVNWTTHWSGGYFGEQSREHLGEERWNRMYRFNEIADAGAVLTFSSDVVTGYERHRADPFFGMQTALTRTDLEVPLDGDRFPGSVRPEETAKLSVHRLLTGYTIAGARQLRLDQRTGSLEAGKSADLVVLSADPFDVAPDQVASIRCEAVVFEGRVVSGALG